MQDYIIASSTEGDLEAVMAIERLSFPTPWERQAFSDELARPWARLEVLRRVTTGGVVAFCNYWLVADELHILNVAVHPDERRRGHGVRLLEHMLSEASRNKTRVVSLEVRLSNHAARALYRKFGFREVGTRPRYYADNGEDALLMDRALSP
ncbi:MAG TPA: ribosomal protein S18-alanine N-acetyltransferase [Polyangia bacterium]